MKIVCLGQQNWDVCWTAKQQLCTRLARAGHSVLYVDPDSVEEKLDLPNTLRALAPAATRFRVREHESGVDIYTHVHAPPLRWRLNSRLRGPRLSRVTASLGMQDGVVLAIHPQARALLPALRPRAAVYYAVDEMSAFHRDPVVQRRMRREEELLMRECEAVIAVSPRLHERFARFHPNAHLLPNAADVEHFAPASLESAPSHAGVPDHDAPTIGLIGQIDERVDQGLLTHVARQRPGWRILLAGRVKAGVDISALEAEPNIFVLGYQPYERLPSVLRVVDVCIVPYHLTALTHACNPLKVWEYLATGRPVVATPLESLESLSPLVSLAASPAEFLAALDGAVLDPERGREARLAFAAANGWEERVTRLESILRDAEERADRKIEQRRQRVLADPVPRGQSLAFPLTRAAGRLTYALRLTARLLTGRPARVRRILVARRCRLGDLVVLLPMLRALRVRFPGARIVLGVQSDFGAGALLQAGFVDEVRAIDVLDRPERLGGALALLRLFLSGYDLVITGATYLVLREAFLVGAPRIAGVDDGHPLHSLLDIPVRLLPTSHEVDNNLAVAEALGADIDPDDRFPRLEPPLDAEPRAAALLAELNAPARGELLVIHPGSQKPSRRWPAERFGAMAERLLRERPELTVIVTGVPGEAQLIRHVLANIAEDVRPRAFDAAGRTDLNGLLALLARCDAFVCNDTGTLHLARALGTPMAALLGPENNQRWGPYSTGAAPAVVLRHEVPCAPCVRWDCGPHFCMRSLGVEQVVEAVRQLLEGPRAIEAPAPLVQNGARHAWRDLHRDGSAVPRIAVALAVAPDSTQAERIVALDASIASLGAQDYPALELLVLLPEPRHRSVPTARNGALLRFIGAAGTDLVRCALANCEAPFLLLARAGQTWAPYAIGRIMADVVRGADGVLAAAEVPDRELSVALENGPILIRRDAQDDDPRLSEPEVTPLEPAPPRPLASVTEPR